MAETAIKAPSAPSLSDTMAAAKAKIQQDIIAGLSPTMFIDHLLLSFSEAFEIEVKSSNIE
jgi:hypothetical protein